MNIFALENFAQALPSYKIMPQERASSKYSVWKSVSVAKYDPKLHSFASYLTELIWWADKKSEWGRSIQWDQPCVFYYACINGNSLLLNDAMERRSSFTPNRAASPSQQWQSLLLLFRVNKNQSFRNLKRMKQHVNVHVKFSFFKVFYHKIQKQKQKQALQKQILYNFP